MDQPVSLSPSDNSDIQYMFHMVNPLFSSLVSDMIDKKPDDPVNLAFSINQTNLLALDFLVIEYCSFINDLSLL